MSSTRNDARPQRPTISQVTGELLVTFGVVLLLFAFYEAFWTNVEAGKLQDEAASDLNDKWDRTNPRVHHRPDLGEAFAQMYIPTFGSDYAFAIIEGTNEDSLLAGPGHYEETQMPAEPGNFAVAGHRVGKGAPFNDLGQLESCDAIVVETATQWVTYRVLPMGTDPAAREGEAAACLSPDQAQRVAGGDYSHVMGRHITLPGDVSVLEPLPGASDAENPEPVITLTTCHPQFSNAERMIVHAMQTEVQDKSAGTPAAFEEVA
ncbi:class E sortase [Corynebacterium sp.]|uniref:class E sortase n=1 Tax=Corynebacterium sp. TaxID=1720 RepID=UPI003735BCA0